jgi:chromosome segregation ATPase
MGRFFASIRRWFDFFFLRRSEDVRRSADGQFTGSVEGIRAAYAIDRDRLAKDFRGLQEAVAQVLQVSEDKKIRLERLDAEEKELQNQLNGAIRAAEQAQATGDTASYEKAQAAYTRYKARLTEIDATQEQLTAEVAGLEKSIQTHMGRLTEFQARLEALPQEEAETVADFVSAKQIIELNNRLMNASDSLKEGPTATVREQVRQMSSQARITEKLAGTDVKLQDQEYATLGKQLEGEDSLEAVLKARKAQRAAAEGTPLPDQPVAESGAAEPAPAERPRI